MFCTCFPHSVFDSCQIVDILLIVTSIKISMLWKFKNIISDILEYLLVFSHCCSSSSPLPAPPLLYRILWAPSLAPSRGPSSFHWILCEHRSFELHQVSDWAANDAQCNCRTATYCRWECPPSIPGGGTTGPGVRAGTYLPQHGRARKTQSWLPFWAAGWNTNT